ncbi:F0F1 ATP synthase subunit B family protein [Desulfoscipio gibsoniae]|uniref:ATP synthase subunit b n=1 Tax=Desulfoscipio gibsoniae DSM 7213 TaxID=767817 RepID=R4KL73_9FIRM|nr:ATP synthase subunit B [Desulfoscipio gibsoniae]AGL03409.1 alternate F1F0 ATPase, F0 subunit B [Desulfoscipio gibsoniae DSM 7213]
MHVDWFTVLAQVINFLIFVALLKRFLYGPILRNMDQREAGIAARLEKAAQKEKDAGAEAEAFRQKLRELEEQSAAMLASVREEAEALRKDLSNRARNEVNAAQARWYEAFQEQKNTLLLDLRRSAGKQVYAVAKQALRDLAGVKLNQQMIEAFMQQFRAIDPGERSLLAQAIGQSGGVVVLRSAFEIDPEMRAKVDSTIREVIAGDIELRFETVPGLIAGLEMTAHGRQVAWHLDNYLDRLKESFARVLDEEILPEKEEKEAS